MILLDTSFLVDYLDGKEKCLRFLKERREERFTASKITFFELYRGAIRSGERENMETIDEKLNWIEKPEEVDEMKEAARIENELKKKGGPINLADLLIAGKAKRKGIKIVSNESDFEKIEDLTIENYD